MKKWIRWLSVVVAMNGFSWSASAVSLTWKNNTTGDWSVAANWNEGVVPASGDDVVITNTGSCVILSSSSSNLASLTLNKTLLFTNWNTTLFATNVTILTNGIMTLPAAFTTNQMSNNLCIFCSNMTINAGGKIDVDGKGYARENGPGTTLTGGTQRKAGGSHGGYGFGGPPTYGAANAPVFPGSGGANVNGASGGGAVRIQATGMVTVNGLITANGNSLGSSDYCGAGSGGSIYIDCYTFSGINGSIRANGGNGTTWSQQAGGGGRIAVIYNTSAQSTLTVPSVVFSVLPGTPPNPGVGGGPSDIGTLYFPDNRFLTEAIMHNGQWIVPGQTGWSADHLLLSNAWFRFTFNHEFALTITNNVLITKSGRLELSGGVVTQQLSYQYPYTRPNIGMTSAPVFSVGGNLVLSNAGSLYIYGATTNPALMDYGALVTVQGDVSITSNSWIYPYSHPTNGGSPLFLMRNLTITTNAGFNAYGMGYMSGGPGAPVGTRAGGSYGGIGGASGGSTYGSSNAPMSPGSSGKYDNWNHTTASGGGLVRIQASDRVTMSGLITAAGTDYGVADSGGGSGGGVYITCQTFAGTNGVIKASGGAGSWMGSGGGGRIAIWRAFDRSSGVTASVAGGTVTSGTPGAPGTVVWGELPSEGIVIQIY